jgi:hypothetical protein
VVVAAVGGFFAAGMAVVGSDVSIILMALWALVASLTL